MSQIKELDERMRFHVNLSETDVTVVSFKDLVKESLSKSRKKIEETNALKNTEANEFDLENGSKSFPPPLGANPALEARLAPSASVAAQSHAASTPKALLPNPPHNRFNSVIEKIERLYAGHVSDGENEEVNENDDSSDQYDTDDSFIDDDELDEYFAIEHVKPKHSGFFINKGELEIIDKPINEKENHLNSKMFENSKEKLKEKEKMKSKSEKGKEKEKDRPTNTNDDMKITKAHEEEKVKLSKNRNLNFETASHVKSKMKNSSDEKLSSVKIKSSQENEVRSIDRMQEISRNNAEEKIRRKKDEYENEENKKTNSKSSILPNDFQRIDSERKRMEGKEKEKEKERNEVLGKRKEEDIGVKKVNKKRSMDEMSEKNEKTNEKMMKALMEERKKKENDLMANIRGLNPNKMHIDKTKLEKKEKGEMVMEKEERKEKISLNSNKCDNFILISEKNEANHVKNVNELEKKKEKKKIVVEWELIAKTKMNNNNNNNNNTITNSNNSNNNDNNIHSKSEVYQKNLEMKHKKNDKIIENKKKIINSEPNPNPNLNPNNKKVNDFSIQNNHEKAIMVEKNDKFEVEEKEKEKKEDAIKNKNKSGNENEAKKVEINKNSKIIENKLLYHTQIQGQGHDQSTTRTNTQTQTQIQANSSLQTPSTSKQERPPSTKPITKTLERAIEDFEKIVNIQEFESTSSLTSPRKRLPPGVLTKLSKIAFLANKDGKIPLEIENKLMQILGHRIQLNTLKKHLRTMVAREKKEAESKSMEFEKEKEYLKKMIHNRMEKQLKEANSAVDVCNKIGKLEKSSNNNDNAKANGNVNNNVKVENELENKGKYENATKTNNKNLDKNGMDEKCIGKNEREDENIEEKETENDVHLFKWDVEIENRIYDLNLQLFQGVEENRKGQEAKKFYSELVSYWPKGWMQKKELRKMVMRVRNRRLRLSI